MSRARTLKPEWLEDEILAACDDSVRMLSAALILIADDYGNGRANPMLVASRAWPYAKDARESVEKASRGIRELEQIGFLTTYQVGGQTYFSLRSWSKHQRVDHPSKPRVPAPVCVETKAESTSRETLASVSRESSETLAPDLIREDRKGSDRTARESESSVIPKHVRRFEDSFRQKPKAGADEVSMADVASTFHAQRKATGGGSYSNSRHRDDEHLEPIAESVNAAGETLEQRTSALRDVVAGFLLDDGAKAAGWPIAWLGRDPGRYLAAWRNRGGAPPARTSAHPLEAEWHAAEKAAQDARMADAPADILRPLERAAQAAQEAWRKAKAAA